MTDERITILEKSLVAANNLTHVVAGYITFNPNLGVFIDSSEIVSLAKNSTLDLTIVFSRDLENYIFNYYGSGRVVLKKVNEAAGSRRILFEEPCPDRVTIVFFEQQA